MKLGYLVFAIVWSYMSSQPQNDSLIPANKVEFESGFSNLVFLKDPKVRKSSGVTYLPKCKNLKDNNSEEDFYEFTYIGDFDNKHLMKVVQKAFYNGYEYLIINTKNQCKITTLLGKPYVFGSYIINFNESETTDAKKVIEIWRLSERQILKVRDFQFSQSITFVDVRISKTKKEFLLKDTDGKFWKFILKA
jgi:hypothetical protein